mgnify:CR=1 FL=1
MLELGRGALSKMGTRLEQPVQYSLRLGEQYLDLNALLGQGVRLEYLGAIHCSHCGRKTKTSFSQGYWPDIHKRIMRFFCRPNVQVPRV